MMALCSKTKFIHLISFLELDLDMLVLGLFFFNSAISIKYKPSLHPLPT